MTEKRVNEYKVIFKQIKDNKGEFIANQAIELSFKNHDDVFKIFEMIEDKNLFNEESQAKQFVLGLKLFGDVMMKNKNMELFSEMQPAFVAFMKKLKSK